MAPGILWVSSRVTQPSRLPREKFKNWYEDQHIDEVVALSKVPSAARYDAVPGVASAVAPGSTDFPWVCKGEWLTLYELDDVNFRFSEEFKGLDGQSKPKEDLLESIFKRAEFQTRFLELVQVDEKEGAKSGPAPLIVTAFLKPPKDAASEEEFDRFYREEHVPLISQCPGYVRTRRYRLCKEPGSSTVLHEFSREDTTFTTSLPWLALHEFDYPKPCQSTVSGFPMQELIKTDQTKWAQSVISKLEGMEAGWFRLTRTYGDYKLSHAEKGKL